MITNMAYFLFIFGGILVILLGILLIVKISRLARLESELQELHKGIEKKEKDRMIRRDLSDALSYDMQKLGIHNEKMNLLIELSDMIQTCITIEEAISVVGMKCKRILHFVEGALYMFDQPGCFLEQKISWGDPVVGQNIITRDQCWALRKKQVYQVTNPRTDLICDHVAKKNIMPYMCIPLMTQDTIFGFLYLIFPSNEFSLSEENRILISTVTKTLSLSFANIKLRETLRNQSLQDSLTGLYNRRYLDEMLPRVFNYAQHHQTCLTAFMIDIDHFKKLNDTYGHELGDVVLREVGKLFQKEFRVSDIVCRYGGEEFICILHGCLVDNARKIADDFREKVSKIVITTNNQKLLPITVSIGIAFYPQDATSMKELIEAADEALYHAKRISRNTTVLYKDHFLWKNSSSF